MKSSRPQIASIRQWWSPAELAEARLPGLPQSERHIRRMIDAGDFGAMARKRGGTRGKEIFWRALPAEAQAELMIRYPGRAGEQADEPKESASAAQARRDLAADAKLQAAEAARRFLAEYRGTKQDGLNAFCKAFKRRHIDLSPAVYSTLAAVTPAQVTRWIAALGREDAFHALTDKRGRPKASGLFAMDERLRAYVVAQVAARPHLSATLLNSAIATDLDRTVPLRTLQAFLKSWRAVNAPTLKALIDPDRHRSHHKPAFGSRSEDVTFINARWELDATRADAMCLMPDGSMRRFALTQLIDVFSRRAIIVVSDNPRAAASMALIRRAILTWGIPAAIKSDNGKEFIAAAVKRLCADLNIELIYSKPFTPEEKPHVERFFGTLNRGLFPLLPGFVGHNIGMRKAIESRNSFSHRFGIEARLVFETSLSPEGLQARIDHWMTEVYENELHSGLNATPKAVADLHAAEARFIADERLLDALLFDAPDAGGIRTVLKKGISVSGRWFIAPELGARMGYRVHVRRDPFDLGRIVVYNAERTQFVCIAEDPDVTGADRRMIAVKAQGVQRKHLRLVRDAVRGIQGEFPSDGLADRMLTAAAGDAFIASDEAKRAMDYAGPRLIAQREGIDALDAAREGPQPVEPSDEAKAIYAEHVAELEARCAPPPARMEQCDGYERPAFVGDDDGFFDWCAAWIAAGNALDSRDGEIFDQLRHDQTFMALRAMKNKRA